MLPVWEPFGKKTASGLHLLSGIHPLDHMTNKPLIRPLGCICLFLLACFPSLPRLSAQMAEELRVAYAQPLVDQGGSAFTLDSLRGKIVALNFIFTRCPVACPQQTASLKRVQDRVNLRWEGSSQFVSVSLDPKFDTPERMGEFASRFGADLENWTFGTGDLDAIRSLSTLLNAEAIAGSNGVEHRMAVFLLNEEGELLRHYSLIEGGEEKRLIEDMLAANEVRRVKSMQSASL